MNTSKDNASTTKSSATYSNKVLVFSSREMDSFFQLLYRFCQNTEIEVLFTDGDAESFSSIKDLVKYIEIYKQTIYKLYFKGSNRKSEPEKSIRIEIINSHYDNFSMYIEGPRDQTKQLKENIKNTLNTLNSITPWNVPHIWTVGKHQAMH